MGEAAGADDRVPRHPKSRAAPPDTHPIHPEAAVADPRRRSAERRGSEPASQLRPGIPRRRWRPENPVIPKVLPRRGTPASGCRARSSFEPPPRRGPSGEALRSEASRHGRRQALRELPNQDLETLRPSAAPKAMLKQNLRGCRRRRGASVMGARSGTPAVVQRQPEPSIGRGLAWRACSPAARPRAGYRAAIGTSVTAVIAGRERVARGAQAARDAAHWFARS